MRRSNAAIPPGVIITLCSSNPNLFFIHATTDNIGIGNNTPLYKLQVSGTVSTTGFRMTDGASDGYFLKSDANGVASWSPVEGDIAGITAGDGLTGGGSSGYVTLDVDFGTVSSIAYVDNGTASLWAAIESNNELSEILSNGNETLGNDMIVSGTDYLLFGDDNISTGHSISGATSGDFFIKSPNNIEVKSGSEQSRTLAVPTSGV